MKLNKDPLCECCMQSGLVVPAVMVHHLLDIDTHPDSALDMKYMMSLCLSCHSAMEAGGSLSDDTYSWELK